MGAVIAMHIEATFAMEGKGISQASGPFKVVPDTPYDFWFRLMGEEVVHFISLPGDCTIREILSAIYFRYETHFRSSCRVGSASFITMRITGKTMTGNEIIKAGTATTVCPRTAPAEICWDREDISAFYAIIRDPNRGAPLTLKQYCENGTLDTPLLNTAASEKYRWFFNPEEINEAATSTHITAKSDIMDVTCEVAIVVGIIALIKYAIRSAHEKSRLKHFKVILEFPLQYDFPEGRILYKVDIVLTDIMDNLPLLITEAKLAEHQTILDAMKQNIDQLRLLRLIYRFPKVYGVATTYSEWVIIEYECKAGAYEEIRTSKVITTGRYGKEDQAELRKLITMIRAAICMAFEARSIDLT